jgi:hypothetical protein
MSTVEIVLKLRTQASPVFELTEDESLRLLVRCTDDILQTTRSRAVISQLKRWEQAILAERCNSVGFQIHSSNRRYRLEWITDPTWMQFRKVLLKLKNEPMVIENGNGIDLGAPRREFYSKLSPKLQHLFVTVDGYLMPRNDLESIDISALKILLQRLVYVDYVLLQTTSGNSRIHNVRPELDLHPALLILMTLPDITDGKTQWNQITQYFGSWLSDIVPRASHERKLSSIYSELSRPVGKPRVSTRG